MLKDDILNSLSIGYTPIDYEYNIHQNGSKIRFIKSAKLWEVSLVTFPANEGAKITNIKNNEAQRFRFTKVYFDPFFN